MDATGKFSTLWRIDRTANNQQVLAQAWTGGGNDYAGCAGSGDVFNDVARAAWDLLPAQITRERTQNPNNLQINQDPLNIGCLGVNSSVSIDDISDGTHQTILIAEAERLTTVNNANNNLTVSSDGWAWGGPSTMFSGLVGPNKRTSWEYAGGPHEGIVQIGMADGSVQQVSESINLSIWQRLANFGNGLPVEKFTR